MKKITLFLSLIYSLTNGYAQHLKTSIGFQGGVSKVSQQISEGGVIQKFDASNGITIGLLLDKPIGNHFSFQTGLSYVSKGSIQKYSGIQRTNTFKLKYIEFPVSFLLKSGANNSGFFAGIGGTVSYGVDAIIIVDQGQGNITKINYSFGNGENDVFKPFDLGAYFQAGIEFNFGLLLSANYYLGVSNTINANDQRLTNRYIAVKLGFLFNNK
jgi:hypothetical protein